MDLGDLKGAVVTIALVVMIAAAAAIGMTDFKDGLDYCSSSQLVQNTSGCGTEHTPCTNLLPDSNSTSSCVGSDSYAYNESIDGLTGISNATNFMDTIGTILGVAVLIGLVVLAFSFGRR